MKILRSGWVVMFAFSWPASAHAVGYEFPTGKPFSTPADWPQGLTKLVKSGKRVHGYAVNSGDFHFYSGDADALTHFLKEFAEIPLEKRKIVLVAREGRAESPWWKQEKKEPLRCDWMLSVTRNLAADETRKESRYKVIIEVYLKPDQAKRCQVSGWCRT